MTRHIFVSFCVGLIVLGATHRPIETKMIGSIATYSEFCVAIDPIILMYIEDPL